MAGKFGKYLEAAITAPGKTLNKVADVAAAGTVRVGKPMAKGIGKSMVTKTDPAFHNLWTGYREGPGAMTVAAAGAVGYGTYQGYKGTTFAPKLGEVSYGGVPAVMNADGVSTANQAPMGAGAPTLGATGNMVFGLHNARKG